MTDSYEDILKETLTQLHNKRQEKQEEIIGIDKAISGINDLLGKATNNELPTESVKKSVDSIPNDNKKKSPKKVKDSEVRDAIVAIYKEPFPASARPRGLNDGYFIISNLADVLGVHPSNNGLRNALAKFVKKGILESDTFRNGNQYRYIPPAETGPGIAHTSHSIPVSTNGVSEPIPGAGNGKTHTRDKDVEKMIRSAERQGFVVEHRGNGHLRVFNPKNNKGTTISATSNTSRHPTRVRADLVEIGVSL